MKSPPGNTAIIFARFTKFYTIPIILIFLAMKVVFDTPFWLAILAGVWDFVAMTTLFFMLHSITRGRFREGRAVRSPILIVEKRNIDVDLRGAFNGAISATKQIKGFRAVEYPTQDGGLIGITGTTINSLGELVKITPHESESTIEITSRPAFNAGFGDGGKNRANVELILTALEVGIANR